MQTLPINDHNADVLCIFSGGPWGIGTEKDGRFELRAGNCGPTLTPSEAKTQGQYRRVATAGKTAHYRWFEW